MATYSIKELETMTGIKAHTIRIWEKRHKLLKPKRTDTNIRVYDDDDLRTLINVASLNSRGIKISKISTFSSEEVDSLVEETNVWCSEEAATLELLKAILVLDESKVLQVLGKSIEVIGFEETVVKLVYPFLNRVGVLWQTGRICSVEEHFINNLIRQKLYAEIDKFSNASSGSKTEFVLYLPEGEYHEIGLLLAQYLLRKRNIKTIYLGESVPLIDLFDLLMRKQPAYLVTSFMSCANPQLAYQHLEKIVGRFPQVKVLVLDKQLFGKTILPANCKQIDSLECFRKVEGICNPALN